MSARGCPSTVCPVRRLITPTFLTAYRYSKRSSSAHWDADQMTLVEKRTYRKHMGYDRAPTVLHNHAHLQQVGGVAMPGAR